MRPRLLPHLQGQEAENYCRDLLEAISSPTSGVGIAERDVPSESMHFNLNARGRSLLWEESPPRSELCSQQAMPRPKVPHAADKPEPAQKIGRVTPESTPLSRLHASRTQPGKREYELSPAICNDRALYAPATGFEPVTVRLTVGCSAVELRGIAT